MSHLLFAVYNSFEWRFFMQKSVYNEVRKCVGKTEHVDISCGFWRKKMLLAEPV